MIHSSQEMSSTAQLYQGGTETLYGVKRRMNLRLAMGQFRFQLVVPPNL